MAKSSKAVAAAAAEEAVVEDVVDEMPPHPITQARLDTLAQTLYAALVAHHQNQYPRTNTTGESFDSWAQLTGNQKEAYRVAAQAVLTQAYPSTPPPPPRAIAFATADEMAQTLYSGLSAAHGYRYPQTNRLGDVFDPWAQLSVVQKQGYANAAFAVVSTYPPPPTPPGGGGES